MDRMRTPLLTSLILIASSSAVFAQQSPPETGAGAQPAPEAAPPPQAAPAPVPAPAAPPPVVSTPIPPTPPSAVATSAPDTVPEVAEPVVKIGVERLPASAYPE